MGPPGPAGSGGFSAQSCTQVKSAVVALSNGLTMSATCPVNTYVVAGAPTLSLWDQGAMCIPGKVMLSGNNKLVATWIGTCSANWMAYVWVLCCP